MHVYDFITDFEQLYLKNVSRRINENEPFEQTLVSYSQLFMQQMEKLTIDENSKYLSDDLKKNEGLKAWFKSFLYLIKQDHKQIQDLFDDLINVYEILLLPYTVQ